MVASATSIESTNDDWELQTHLLLQVSRTFALTIPQLPDQLQKAVGNGYLLCRIADTIEDDPGIELPEKLSLYEEFLEVLNGRSDAADFAERFDARLSSDMSERELIRATPTVVRLTHSLNENQQRALIRCVAVMSNGMYEYQAQKSLDGLATLRDTSRYCYVVAGIVGEMLTDLFCDYSSEMRERRDQMMALAVCFGQGLQMTNILKDVWEDRESGACWLPRSVFARHGVDLGAAIRDEKHADLAPGIVDLVGITHANLKSALAYNSQIPKGEVGIRRFCLLAIGMAVLTLQKIYRNPSYASGDDVKISRRQVWTVVLSANSVIYSDRLLRAWFEVAARGLPVTENVESVDPVALSALVHSGPAGTGERHIRMVS